MIHVSENTSLLMRNTFRVDAKTRYLVEVTDIEDIKNYIGSELHAIQPKMVLGAGSNVLFTRDFDGCIIQPVMKGVEIISESAEFVILNVGAGENWDDFVAYCVEKGWGGIENLSGIPGTAGASPVQNIGASGMEVKDTIVEVETINLESGIIKQYNNQQCRFSYRNSIFRSGLKNREIITHVVFKLRKDHAFVTSYHDLNKELDHYPEINLKNIRNAIIKIRQRKLPDPGILANAGSFFKNPLIDKKKLDTLKTLYPNMPCFEDADGNIKLSAAWLIEHCGWKGRRIGKTGTYHKQPLVIVNYGGASGTEILKFAQKIQHAVLNDYNIRLEMEVNIV
jgi:UDP-N-acetylmuramate dehydrogenase